MKIETIELMLHLEKGSYQPTLTRRETIENETLYEFHGEEGITACVKMIEKDNITEVYATAQVEQTPFRENNSFIAATPMVITLKTDQKKRKLCAQYQHRDWWSRPSFLENFGELPERTQSLFVREEKQYLCFIPMVGDKTKSYLQGNGEDLQIQLTAYTGGISHIDDCCLIWGEGDIFYHNNAKVWKHALALKGTKEISQRPYPDMFEYLGWCSWDAFYTDINEEKVRSKVKEIKEKNIPIKWILLDDGWLAIKDQRLYSLEPEKDKFPHGFQQLTEDIREETDIEHIGVWHAFGGYWGGILPGSDAAAECRENLYETKNGKLLPHFDSEKGFGFWSKWYQLLQKQGIDFVKVDGQSALKNYYRHNEEIGKVAKGAHKALEGAVNLYMGGNLINCMGMAAENIFNRPTSGLSRNSDDFVPGEEKGFREHMLQNAYNALYHNQVYHCDWDMFWSRHKDAYKHAMVRAISGGPVYISDRIDETCGEVLEPLAYKNGKILRMDRCALPTVDCIFDSPLTETNMTLTNVVNNTGAAALFHLGEIEEAITTSVRAKDIPDFSNVDCLVYDHETKEVTTCLKEEAITVILNKDQCRLLLFVPFHGEITPIGLIDKYMSCHSLETIKNTDKQCNVRLKDGGIFAFYSDKGVNKILVNQEKWEGELTEVNKLYTMDLSSFTGSVEITIIEA